MALPILVEEERRILDSPFEKGLCLEKHFIEAWERWLEQRCPQEEGTGPCLLRMEGIGERN